MQPLTCRNSVEMFDRHTSFRWTPCIVKIVASTEESPPVLHCSRPNIAIKLKPATVLKDTLSFIDSGVCLLIFPKHLVSPKNCKRKNHCHKHALLDTHENSKNIHCHARIGSTICDQPLSLLDTHENSKNIHRHVRIGSTICDQPLSLWSGSTRCAAPL